MMETRLRPGFNEGHQVPMYGCCMFSFTSKAMPSVHQAKKLRDSGVPIGWIRGTGSHVIGVG